MKAIYEPVHEPTRPRSRTGGRWLIVAAVGALIGLLAWSAVTSRVETAYNTHNLIRLHVVANSDQPADQKVKLEVRDAILKASGELFGARNQAPSPPDEVARILKENLPLFKRIAENVLRAGGYDYPVNVEFGTFSFPERTYGPLVLPAGDYQALRIVLGEGKGANWWCILFPPLCYLDVVGGLEQKWGLSAGGTLSAAGSGAGGASGTGGSSAGGTRVIPLESLTASQLEDLENVLGRALDNVGSGQGSSSRTEAGVKVILSDIPSSPDTDLVILVADTGSERTEVRFYVYERLRDLIRSLAEAAPPWLLEGTLPESRVKASQ